MPDVTRTAFATRDPELAHDFLGSVYADHTVALSGRRDGFGFRHEMAGAAGFAVARVRHTGRVRIDAAPLHDVLSITTFHRGPAEITHGRATVDAARGDTLLTPTGPMRTRWDDLDNTSVVLDARAVRAHAAALLGVEPARLDVSVVRPRSAGLARHWRDTVAHVREVVLAPHLAAGPLVLADAFQQLATAVLTVFPHSAEPDELPRRVTVSDAAVRRTVEHIDTHAGDPVGPADLAAAAGVPYRDLHRAFHRRTGRSPARQLWRARLEGAHRDLAAADPGRGDTVTAIAARWGFGDPARFRVVYGAAFGRAPEQTLGA